MVDPVSRETYIGVRGLVDLGEVGHSMDWHSAFGRTELISDLCIETPTPFCNKGMNTGWDHFRATSGT